MCYLSLLEAGRPEDKLECKYNFMGWLDYLEKTWKFLCLNIIVFPYIIILKNQKLIVIHHLHFSLQHKITTHNIWFQKYGNHIVTSIEFIILMEYKKKLLRIVSWCLTILNINEISSTIPLTYFMSYGI